MRLTRPISCFLLAVSIAIALPTGSALAKGTAKTKAPLLKSLNAIAVRENLPGGGYAMDHSATLYLLDREGRLVAVFSPPFSVAALAADLHRVDAARRL